MWKLGRLFAVLRKELLLAWALLRDPRAPKAAKLATVLAILYVLSPIDLIPDPIPVLGYLDDLIIVPLGVALALKMIPAEVMAECRAQAQEVMRQGKPVNRVAAVVIAAIWVALAALGIVFVMRVFRG